MPIPSARRLRSSLLLLLTALIWGLAFVAQRFGMDYIGPFLFVALRMLFGAVTLLIVLWLTGLFARRKEVRSRTRCDRQAAQRDGSFEAAQRQAAQRDGSFVLLEDSTSQGESLLPATQKNRPSVLPASVLPQKNRPSVLPACHTAPSAPGDLRGRRLLLAGGLSGLVLFFAGCFQQIGMVDIDAGKAGFLTALYIVLVPVLGIVLRHKTHWNTWTSVLIAVVGLYCLCVKEGQSIQFGDLVILIGAFGWACHILVIDHFVEGISHRAVLKLCVAQFALAGALALVASLFLDRLFVPAPPTLALLLDAAPAFLYVGILSTGIAFTFQAVGQQGLSPAAASLLMSLESVFAVIGGTLLLGESMDAREYIGCALMFAAVALSQLPVGRARAPVI